MLSKSFFESVYKMNERTSDNYNYTCDANAIGGCGALGYNKLID